MKETAESFFLSLFKTIWYGEMPYSRDQKTLVECSSSMSDCRGRALLASAIVRVLGILLVLHALKEQRGKRAYTLMLWKGVLKLWR